MSGISFKIQAPPRPSSSASNGGQGPTASSSSAGSRRPTSNLSRTASARTTDRSADVSSDDDEEDASMGRDSYRRDKKRTRLLDDGDEEVVEFGATGAKSKHAKAPTGPLVIAALPNKDWRKAAEDLRANRSAGGGGGRRQRKELYLPEASNGSMSMQSGSRTTTGARDVDAINTEEVVGGLSVGAASSTTRPGLTSSGGTEEAVEQVRQEIDAVVGVTTPSLASTTTAADSPMSTDQPPASSLPPPVPQVAATAMTDEQRALRELLGHDAAAGDEADQVPEAIYSAPDNRGGPIDEAEAFKRDLDTRPDEASLEDYARVPVGQFGLAMLRGMGWQPGQAASRSGRGAIEAHVPSARPSLLGIGAKPMAESLGTEAGGAKKGGKPAPRVSKRDEMRFVPLVKKEREGSARAEASEARRQIDSGSSSRRTSRSPPPGSTSSSRHTSRRGSPSRREYSDRDERDRDRDRRDRESSWRRSDRDSDRRRRDDRERDHDSDSRRHRRREDEPSYHRSSREDESSRSYRSRGDDRRDRDFAGGDAGSSSSSSRRDDRRREGGERDDRDRRERERR